AQAAARELGPKGIHVAHLVIDAGVDTAWVRERMRASSVGEDRVLLQPASVANAYWALHQQTSDAWTFETEIRPSVEPW
ncbi:MAG TPA: short-chain dehydrogenase, partial [Caulobacter sp.]|nr:short-chain dehydrogenase [Caulobacter sp.]